MSKKKKHIWELPEAGYLIKNHRILIEGCCDCGLRHAFYYEVVRGKKPIDDMIYIQCERIESDI